MNTVKQFVQQPHKQKILLLRNEAKCTDFHFSITILLSQTLRNWSLIVVSCWKMRVNKIRH